MTLDEIEWMRVAEPQQDGYDTEVALALAGRDLGWSRSPPAAPPHLFDAQVGLRAWPPHSSYSPSLEAGALDHPNLTRAEDIVRAAWPAVHRQFAKLVAEIAPMTVKGSPISGSNIGSYSGHSPQPPFGIYVTYFDSFGTAESFVHEMAHVKLRCLGVQIESSTRLITNSPSELYYSPLRSYRRPMTAVVHAFYSWLHVTELDLRWATMDVERALIRMERNCRWIDAMALEIYAHVRTDEAGAQFLPGLFDWAERLVTGGRKLLQSTVSESRNTLTAGGLAWASN